jgi:hypothetical protein
MTIPEYRDKYPDAEITSSELRAKISAYNKGKTYVERYGQEKADELIKKRVTGAHKQFEDPEQRERRKQIRWKGYKQLSGSYIGEIERVAKRTGKDFKITPEYMWDLLVEQNFRCAISGVPIYLEVAVGSINRKGYQLRTASLDRIDSTMGYIVSNVQWLHREVNQMKSDRLDEDYINWCKVITAHQNNK